MRLGVGRGYPVPMRGAMRILSGAICLSLAFPSISIAASVTMPVNDSMGGPVTITVGDARSSSSSGPSRSGSYERASPPQDESGESSDDGAWLLAAIVAAPVVIIGGAFYIAGEAVTDWLRDWQTERERRKRDEAERRRLVEEDRIRIAEISAHLDAEANAGRETLYDALTAVLDAASSEAAAEEPFPYRESDVVTNIGGEVATRENAYNAAILEAYRRLWDEPGNRALLKLIAPKEFKAILAHESGFKSSIFAQCAKLVVNCAKKGRTVDARSIGVGIAALVRKTAMEAPLNLRIDDQVDERLDPDKALTAALRLLIAYHARIVKIYQEQRAAPDSVFLWELTVLSYNTSPYRFKPVLLEAAKESGLSIGKVRLAEILKAGEGGSSPLEQFLGRKKFNQEASDYLNGVRRMLPRNDPRRGGL